MHWINQYFRPAAWGELEEDLEAVEVVLVGNPVATEAVPVW